MQSLIALVALFVIYVLVWTKRCGYDFISFMRILVKRVALCVMSFSWIVVLAAVLVLVCYSNITELLRGVLSVNSVSNIKSLIRLIFGVDSAFVALQMLVLYSLMVSFISCLVLSVGCIVRLIYKTVLKSKRATLTEKSRKSENSIQRTAQSFKLYLKYNS